MRVLRILIVTLTVVTSTAPRAILAQDTLADPWAAFIEAAAEQHGDFGRRAAEFLTEHRPERDATIDLELLNENLWYALWAREQYPWARALSEERFFNDVLPYAVLDETRELWRADFVEIVGPIVADCTTATEAAQAINRDLFNIINVHYNTGRKKPNQSPSESIEQGRATCTGLSIILVDACRAVGVPARIAGVAKWNGKNGNHTWVEIWDDGWHYTGADEYDANGLNRAWFTGDASRAVAGDSLLAVWATSWQPTGHRFPMVWNMRDHTVHAVDVTERYAPTADRSANDASSTLYLRVWTTRGGDRIVAHVEVFTNDAELIDTVTTKAGTADLNDMPKVKVDAEAAIRIIVRHNNVPRTTSITPEGPGKHTIDLYWDELEPIDH